MEKNFTTFTSTARANRWRHLFNQWRSSGMSQAGFCKHHSIPLSTFGYWKRKLTHSEKNKPTFYPLAVPHCSQDSQEEKKTGITLSVAGGRFEISLEKRFSSSTLKNLITTLEKI